MCSKEEGSPQSKCSPDCFSSRGKLIETLMALISGLRIEVILRGMMTHNAIDVQGMIGAFQELTGTKIPLLASRGRPC